MFNYNSPIVQNMINSGQFGTQTPLQLSAYNPYEQYGNPYAQQYNNIIPIGQIGYNQIYNQPQMPETNNYIFAPTQPQQGYAGNPYQHPYFNNGGAYAKPQYDYYDPYGYKGYNNPYGGYQNYYGGYYSPQLYQRQQKQQQELLKTKYRIAGKCFGKEYSDAELEAIVNPVVRVQQISQEQREILDEARKMSYYESLLHQPPVETMDMRTAACIHDMKKNYHDEFDNHTLREFLDEDLWKLNREFWLRENVKYRGRDLSNTYSSNDYNELLNMHKSSNPYVNELLDTSRYDNNLDDMEIGLPEILDMQKRRKQVLEGRVPTYISSEETQKRRHEFTNQILNQIYNKGGTK